MSDPAIPGNVMLTVIPDIREKLPFDPFTPKVSANTLAEIEAFLKSRVSIHARVAVSNPFYAEVKIRCTVKFNKGVDQLFFQARLNEELKKFLSLFYIIFAIQVLQRVILISFFQCFKN